MEINSSSLQKQSAVNASILFADDDNCVEYAQLNHSAIDSKASTSQLLHTVDKGILYKLNFVSGKFSPILPPNCSLAKIIIIGT